MVAFQQRTDSAVAPGKVDVDALDVIGVQPEITAQLIIQVGVGNLPVRTTHPVLNAVRRLHQMHQALLQHARVSAVAQRAPSQKVG